jgi:hypothetical protein
LGKPFGEFLRGKEPVEVRAGRVIQPGEQLTELFWIAQRQADGQP